MSSYNTLAEFYDLLTDNVDYKVRSDYISGFFSKYGKSSGKLLDLACGTGTLSKLLSDKGYEVTGIDLSDEMLSLADNKCAGKVKLLKGDISNFSLDEKFDFCLCSLDSINHLNDYDDVKSCFSSVYQCLNSGGIFVFDVNTLYKHEFILGDNTFAFDEEDFFLCWDNEYEGGGRVRILLDFFVFNGENYDRFSEKFYETAYDTEDLIKALSDFEIIGIYDELKYTEPADDSQRIYFVCKRK